jgi:hypothetical protein
LTIDGIGIIALTDNSYIADVTQRIELIFDMDADTSKLSISDQMLFL